MILGWIIVGIGIGVAFASRQQICKAAARPANGELKKLAKTEERVAGMVTVMNSVRMFSVLHRPVPVVSK